MRAWTLAHRWLGIALGSLVVVWTVSGFVMTFVSYPRLTEAERIAALAPIPWVGCCADLGAPGSGLAGDDLQVEMLDSHPVLRGPNSAVFDLVTASKIGPLTGSQAAAVAATFANRGADRGSRAEPRLAATVVDDVWTLSGVRSSDRPLYRFALDDEAGREVYVSSTSGRVVQATTRRQRFWSWLGAIPHWLYLVALRRCVRAWSGVVVYASIAGLFLALSGLVIGARSLHWRGGRVSSPYEGVFAWHHKLGMVFGVFACTWTASGLASMNPWGLLEGGDARVERARVRGARLPLDRIVAGMRSVAVSANASGAVSVRVAPAFGTLYFVAERQNGTEVRLDEAGQEAPISADVMTHIAAEACGADGVESVELLTKGDAYYRHSGSSTARLPVVRIVARGGERTQYYLDPESGEFLATFDRAARAYRWIFEGLHRMDAGSGLCTGWCHAALLLGLLGGVMGLSATGVCLGARRLRRWFSWGGSLPRRSGQ